MNVLSLFDGMSCGQIALKELGIKVDNYFASEVDKYAIQQTQHNFPNTIQLGDVCGVKAKDLPKIDLLIGGSPCQGFSFAGQMLNFQDPRSKLFFEFVRILNEVREINPDVFFLLENVRMRKEYEAVITKELGVQPIAINSALVSAQNRLRLYWTNIGASKDLFGNITPGIPQPADRGECIKDILEQDIDDRFYLPQASVQKLLAYNARNKAAGNGFSAKFHKGNEKMSTLKVGGQSRQFNTNMMKEIEILNPAMGGAKSKCLIAGYYKMGNSNLLAREDGYSATGVMERTIKQLNPSTESQGKQPFQQNRVYDADGVSVALCAEKAGQSPMVAIKDESEQVEEIRVRRLTPTECARLQTIPEWYEWVVSASQQYKMLGNGWTVEVIKHIFSFLPEQYKK